MKTVILITAGMFHVHIIPGFHPRLALSFFAAEAKDDREIMGITQIAHGYPGIGKLLPQDHDAKVCRNASHAAQLFGMGGIVASAQREILSHAEFCSEA